MQSKINYFVSDSAARAMIANSVLLALLSALSVQELREVYGLTQLELPWVAIELVVHAMILRRTMQFDVPLDLMCVEFFAGPQTSSQVAKAFTELGFSALAFDLMRHFEIEVQWRTRCKFLSWCFMPGTCGIGAFRFSRACWKKNY